MAKGSRAFLERHPDGPSFLFNYLHVCRGRLNTCQPGQSLRLFYFTVHSMLRVPRVQNRSCLDFVEAEIEVALLSKVLFAFRYSVHFVWAGEEGRLTAWPGVH